MSAPPTANTAVAPAPPAPLKKGIVKQVSTMCVKKYRRRRRQQSPGHTYAALSPPPHSPFSSNYNLLSAILLVYYIFFSILKMLIMFLWRFLLKYFGSV